MSYNHQWPHLSEQVYKRYTKTMNGMLTGFRLDPTNLEKTVHWLLQSPESVFEQQPISPTNNQIVFKRIGFNYFDEVIEVYSELEDKVFRRKNQGLISRGVLVEYTGDSTELDTRVMTDTEIVDVASIKNLLAFKKRINEFDSVHALQKIQEAVNTLDRPVSFSKAIQEKLDEFK